MKRFSYCIMGIKTAPVIISEHNASTLPTTEGHHRTPDVHYTERSKMGILQFHIQDTNTPADSYNGHFVCYMRQEIVKKTFFANKSLNKHLEKCSFHITTICSLYGPLVGFINREFRLSGVRGLALMDVLCTAFYCTPQTLTTLLYKIIF